MIITSNILKNKEAKLVKLNTKSVKALDMVTKTIDNLVGVNTEIERSITEIEDYQRRMNDTVVGMTTTRENNNAIIINFRKLIGG